jgi:hypothetical protein
MKTFPVIIQWNKNGKAHALLGVATGQEVCIVFKIDCFVRDGKQVFVVSEIECDASVEPPRPLKLIRAAEFKTLPKARAEKNLWMAEDETKKQASLKKIADFEASRKTELQKIAQSEADKTFQHARIAGEVARVKEAIKSAFARIWPRSIKAMDNGTQSPADTLRSYALDCIGNSGSAWGFPIPEINRATAAEISRAVRSASRSTKKIKSALIDLCIALHWLPPHNWRDKTEAEIATELKVCGFAVSSVNARTRANRLGLYSARESGPKAR